MDYPIKILTKEEKQVLFKIFRIKMDENAVSKLQNKLGKLLLPAGGLFQTKLSYEETIEKIAKKNNIKLDSALKVSLKERQLFLELFSTNFQKLNDKEKQEFLRKLERNGMSKDQVASIVALTGIGAAQLSGFGVYLLASSAVGAITHALGVTLSFATYTAMSSIIKLAIGPIGLVLMAIPLTKIFWKVRNIEDLKDVFISIFKDSRSLVTGNFEGAEIVFQYFAGLRIMKTHQIEVNLTNLNIDIESIKASRENTIKEHDRLSFVLEDKDTELKELELKISIIKEEKQKILIDNKEELRKLDTIENNLMKNEEKRKELTRNLELLTNA